MRPVFELTAALADYRRRHPGETAVVELFEALAADPGPVYERRRLAGHFTGSAWLVDASGQRVLLTHHRKLGRWLQLGGHADGDADLAAVALKEAEEESGLGDLVVEPAIFDLDRHAIPARGEEPEHWHYDVRFVVRTTGGEQFAVGEESLDLAWKPVSEIAADPSADDSLRRMAAKWREKGTGAICPEGLSGDR